jgi:hypothetical protein
VEGLYAVQGFQLRVVGRQARAEDSTDAIESLSRRRNWIRRVV